MLVDQRKLPAAEVYVTCKSVNDVAKAIKTMAIRGAPAIGVCAAMGLALFRGIRERYPDWRYVLDGDGGDENLKDYPIEENPELTIRSVVSNLMLYQEGWGVGRIKHSLTYSGGHSRGCVRGWAPTRRYGFLPFSPFTRPAVVAAAEAIPFAALAGGSHERLYALKGEVLARGLRRQMAAKLREFEGQLLKLEGELLILRGKAARLAGESEGGLAALRS